jgi:hypothetical protein
MFIIAQIWSIAFSIQMIMYNKKRIIKFDLGSTICVSAALLFAEFGLIFYFFVILKFLKNYTLSTISTSFEMDQTNKRFNQLTLIAQSSPPIFIILAILPLFNIKYPEYGKIFMRVILIVNGMGGLIYGGMVTNVLGYVLKILSDHMNDFDQHNIEMKIVYVRLQRAYHIIRVMSVATGAAFILFGSFDYLLIRSTYFIVVCVFTFPPGSIVLMITVNIFIYLCIYMYIYIYTYICVCIYIYIYIFICMYMNIYIYI